MASYPAFTRGAELGLFIRDPSTGYFYIGENWPGYGVWVDWLHPMAQDYWTAELMEFYDSVPFDALWVDLNEISSACSFSCGNVLLNDSLRSISTDISNVILQDPRKLDFPPYKINNAKPSKQIIEETIALSARHNNEYATAEYDVHSLWSVGVLKATYNAIRTIMPGKRPFMVSRSTFAGSGQYSGHWGGDNEAKWGAMFLSISQAFTFQMSGVPLFGADTCGFGGDSSEELCARWMELSAFFPFYRNHYAKGKHPQEAYVWPAVAEASRRAIGIRYSLLAYMYTLLHDAHSRGDTVMRALAWEFPNDRSLRDTDTQFLLGPSLLVTPVLEPDARTVKGVFPGIGEGTIWYDWYTLQEVKGVRPQENVTMDAPLEHINLHIRGGSILPLQKPGNTTTATRMNPYNLVIAPDAHGHAIGSLYLDDGESIEPSETKSVEVSVLTRT
jgi:alpha-glucosidase